MALDPQRDDVSAIVTRMTDGIGADVALECSGYAIHAALSSVRRGGRVVVVGSTDYPASVNPQDLVLTEKRLIGSVSHIYDEDSAHALDLLTAQAIDVKTMVSDRIPLTDVIDGGFKRLEHDARAIKILVSPS